jgi:predicted nucleic acid-binding protein
MIRAVLDTNVLLAALRSRNGASFEILSRFTKREVLKRECSSFGQNIASIDKFLDALCAGASYVKTSSFWKPALPDPDDEAFAQLALEAKAGYIVTHNQRHFPSKQLPAVKVVSPQEFLDILRS